MTAAVVGRIPVAAHNTRGRHASLSACAAHGVRRPTSSHRCKSHERIRRAMDTNGLCTIKGLTDGRRLLVIVQRHVPYLIAPLHLHPSPKGYVTFVRNVKTIFSYFHFPTHTYLLHSGFLISFFCPVGRLFISLICRARGRYPRVCVLRA